MAVGSGESGVAFTRFLLIAVSDCCVGKAAFDGFRVGGGELDCVVGVRREAGWVGAGGWRGGRRWVEAIG